MKISKHLVSLIILIISFAHLFGQQYTYHVDLQNIIKDRVKVTCIVPEQTQEVAEFIFPNVIPGSYSLKEFGRYIDDFTAYDESGKKLKVKKADRYNFRILHAGKLKKVEYFVNDSWEEKNGKHFIFQPGGTNIEAGKNFVLNNYGFFGYLDGMKDKPFNIIILKPQNLNGFSYLPIISKNPTTDTLTARNYDFLADNPIMYYQGQAATFKVSGTEISVCLYSENNKTTAQEAQEIVKPLAKALERFFGTLPVDRYMFMFYLADATKVPERKGKGLGSGFGALEHNHCSFYFMPESDDFDRLKDMLTDVCAHEFLHILTPLNIHSREIEDFNFRIPVMSKHLWMYEGVTEYFANLVLMQDSLMTMKDFFKEMRSKIISSSEFDSFSMTDMSKNVVTKENQARYLSVYSRGALLAMMLDILIIDKSEGKNSLRQVMMELAKKYGPSRPFNDDDLLSEFEALSYPEVGWFLKTSIAGTKTPDYNSYFNMIGYDYAPEFSKETYYFGRFGLNFNDEKQQFYFAEVDASNLLGIINNDVLLAINSTEVTQKNINDLFDEYFLNNDEGKSVKLDIIRANQKMTISASPRQVTKTSKHVISKTTNPNTRSIVNLKKIQGL